MLCCEITPRWQSILKTATTKQCYIDPNLLLHKLDDCAQRQSDETSVSSLLSMTTSQKPAWIEDAISRRSTLASMGLTGEKNLRQHRFTQLAARNPSGVTMLRGQIWPRCEVLQRDFI